LFKRKTRDAPVTVAGAAYGVGFTLEAADAKLYAEMLRWLPPAWAEGELGPTPITLSVSKEPEGSYVLARDGRVFSTGAAADVFDDFERQFRNHIAFNATDHVFMHAGAVAHAGRGIVIPGASFSGKTSLVAALVRAGATYYSDEYAVLDLEGNLCPYPKPLSLRLTPDSALQTNHHVDELGGVGAIEAAPIGLIVVTQYRPGTSWAPTDLSRAEAVLAMLEHTFRGQDRPEQTLKTLRQAVERATAVRGDRGEADETIPDLLARALAGVG
jgi:hypothetical protein